MTENGSLFTDGEIYNEFIGKLNEKSIEYSEARKNGQEKFPDWEDALDVVAYIDSKYTDYVNGHNNVTEEDVLKDVDDFKRKGLNKSDLYEDFPMNVRKALEYFKNGNLIHRYVLTIVSGTKDIAFFIFKYNDVYFMYLS